MHLVLALLLQAALPQHAAEARDVLVRRCAQLEGVIRKFDAYFARRLDEDADRPQVGLMVKEADGRDADGRPVIAISAVLRGSPADRAGARIGDRILAIGTRRLDSETTTVVLLLLDTLPQPLTLRVARDGTEADLPLSRERVACLRAAADSMDRQVWRENIGYLQASVAEVRARLDDPAPNPVVRYLAAKRDLDELHALLNGLASAFGERLNVATLAQCGSQ